MAYCLALHSILSVFLTKVYGGHPLCQQLTQCYTGCNGGPDRHGLYLQGAHDCMGTKAMECWSGKDRGIQEGISLGTWLNLEGIKECVPEKLFGQQRKRWGLQERESLLDGPRTGQWIWVREWRHGEWQEESLEKETKARWHMERTDDTWPGGPCRGVSSSYYISLTLSFITLLCFQINSSQQSIGFLWSTVGPYLC